MFGMRVKPWFVAAMFFAAACLAGAAPRAGRPAARGAARAAQPAAAPAQAQPVGGGHTPAQFAEMLARPEIAGLEALKLAIADLQKSFPKQYAHAKELLARAAECEKRLPAIRAGLEARDESAYKEAEGVSALSREALLANPLLDFDKLLLVRRKANKLGLPQNWQGNCSMSATGYDNDIAVLSPVGPQGKLTTLFKPQGDEFAGNLCLNWDADRLLFSMPDKNRLWQVWEMKADGTGLRLVTTDGEPDVHNYDACYLPNGKVIFASTRCFQGVPCVGGKDNVANFCIADADGKNVRQLCFDQDHNWCPTVLNDGRVLYTRWEYSDTPHYFSRLLFRMNPDGTEQMEYYGSNSYWPNSTFYARAIPGHPEKVVAIVSGHHGAARMGELVVLDPEKGRHEADGAVQLIPGRGKKVVPTIADQLVRDSWPKFLHPYPLSDKYFLVASQPAPRALWGIYLVDVFDNRTLIAEEPGYALLEPVALRKTARPPVIPDRVNPKAQDATVYLTDIYVGPGLRGVPRGTVKKLRLYEVHYAYNRMGGHKNIGVQGPWDVHRILGTVPVQPDGSASFKVPANTPISVQPLDAQGRALQVMRSWFTAMPGESLSCVGCHEQQNTGAPLKASAAMRKPPVEITPWRGPARGFDFTREVQPVLDKYCVGCHNGQPRPDGKRVPDFAAKEKNGWGNFTPSYLALHPYVRRPGPESDYHLQAPYEFHASTSELVRMLDKGHYNVKLDDEAWDRLYTWIDLNVPDHGTWHEHRAIPANYHERRLAMRTKYANRPEDPEAIPEIKREPVAFVPPAPIPMAKMQEVTCPGWPFGAGEAKRKQDAAGPETHRTVDLGNGVKLELTRVPAGEFIMGDLQGSRDERPLARVRVAKSFWMGVCEVTNEQYARFDPAHNSGYIHQQHKDHTTPGYPANLPQQPAIRITWREAQAFCRWLSAKTGLKAGLPSEAQWEWACRAGTDTPFFWGGADADFSPYANVADASIKLLAVSGVNPQPIKNPNQYEDFLPKDARFNDGEKIEAPAGTYQANPWGLKDMLGNVAEWTSTGYRPYPYDAGDGREDPKDDGLKVVRGGSWADRPFLASSAVREAYLPWQPVWNVGFRVVISE